MQKVGNNGGPYKTLKGAMNVHDADVHNDIINQYVHQHTATTTTLAANSLANANQLQFTSVVGFAVGNAIHINTTTVETTHPVILTIVGNLVTLDRRLDFAHLAGDIITKVILDLAATGQIGTLAAPQEYFVGPENNQIWHITRILFSMVHGTAGDLGLFGNLTALTNGVLLRAKVSGQYYTLTNWKSNADIKSDMYDVDFDTRSGGGGSFGTSGRGTFTNAGAVLRLDGSLGDRLEVYVQDDITALNLFNIKAQGHREEG